MTADELLIIIGAKSYEVMRLQRAIAQKDARLVELEKEVASLRERLASVAVEQAAAAD